MIITRYMIIYPNSMFTRKELEMATAEEFCESVLSRNANKAHNCAALTRPRYDELVERLQEAVGKRSKTPHDYYLLHRYEVHNIDEGLRLVKKRNSPSEPLLMFLAVEELYTIIGQAHQQGGHCNDKNTLHHLKKKYANITMDQVRLFVSNCTYCRARRRAPREKTTTSPFTSNALPTQVPLDVSAGKVPALPAPVALCAAFDCAVLSCINLSKMPDGAFRFILAYQDLATRFLHLHPLRSDDVEQIALSLVDLIGSFGPPRSLICSAGFEQTLQVLEEVSFVWPEIKIQAEKDRSGLQSMFQESDLEKLILEWMRIQRTKRWSLGIKQLMLMINSQAHSIIEKCPFQCMFGRKALSIKGEPDDDVCIISEENGHREITSVMNPAGPEGSVPQSIEEEFLLDSCILDKNSSEQVLTVENEEAFVIDDVDTCSSLVRSGEESFVEKEDGCFDGKEDLNDQSIQPLIKSPEDLNLISCGPSL